VMPLTCHCCGAGIRKAEQVWLLPPYFGADSPQTPVPHCQDCASRYPRLMWWQAYQGVAHDDYLVMIGHEQAATAILQYQSLVVPGLLQTPEYAREVLGFRHPPPAAEQILELRLRRQELLSKPSCPKIRIVLDEFVLRRGRPETLRDQLDHLATVTATAPVEMRVLPAMILTADPPFMLIDPGGFVFAETADGGNSGGDPETMRWRFEEKWAMAAPLGDYA
jgi:Domain of unknown function (DUF5753)